MRTVIIGLLLACPGFAMAASHSGMGWFETQVVNSLIHGVVYGLIFKLFHGLGLVPSLILGALLLGGAYWFYRNKNR